MQRPLHPAADIARCNAQGIRHFVIGADKNIVSAALARYLAAAPR